MRVAPEEMAATVPGASTLGVPKKDAGEQGEGVKGVLGLQSEQNEKGVYAIFKADSLSRYYVPAVMMGHSRPASPSARMVHILGQDQRSLFLSHALHGVFDSVKLPNFTTKTQYPNVSGNMGTKGRGQVWVTENQALAEAAKSGEDKGHISNLVVAGRPSQAASLLNEVKHRVDDRTTVCYMQDGLGVLEDVTKKVFKNPKTRPSSVLGHMNHALAYNRETSSVRVMAPDFSTYLTTVEGKQTMEEKTADTSLRTQSMVGILETSAYLRATNMGMESWMKLKIPSLMFSSVIDPICVLLDARYDEILYNRTAQTLITHLLDEIAIVVGRMPETRNLPELKASLRSRAMHKQIIGKLRGKGSAPCKMVQQIQRGQLTDIDYLNGYFVERGHSLGVRMPSNEMVVGMVKAKHKAQLERNRSIIPLEATSHRW